MLPPLCRCARALVHSDPLPVQWSREQRSTGGAGSHARWLKHGGTHASQRDLDRGSGVSVTPAHGLKALQHHHPRHPPLRRLKTAASAARLPPGVASSLDGGAAGDITPIADAVRSLAAASGAGRRAGAATRPAALSAEAPEGLTPSLTGLDLPAEDEVVDEAAAAASAAAAARLQEAEEALRVRSIVLLRHMSWIASPAATRLAVQVRPYAEKEGRTATHTLDAFSRLDRVHHGASFTPPSPGQAASLMPSPVDGTTSETNALAGFLCPSAASVALTPLLRALYSRQPAIVAKSLSVRGCGSKCLTSADATLQVICCCRSWQPWWKPASLCHSPSLLRPCPRPWWRGTRLWRR